MNSMLKRLLSFAMAVVMVMSYVVMPVAADENAEEKEAVTCSVAEGCEAENHDAACPKHPDYVAPCTHEGTEKTETVVDATCAAAGSKTVVCACGAVISTETIAATGEHVYGEDGKCICGAEKPEEHTHSYDELVSDTATCTEAGTKTTRCSCGETTETESPAMGHSMSDGVADPVATCAASGVLTKTCNVCGTTETEVIPATGNHNYVDGVCTVCTAAEPDAQPDEAEVICDGSDLCAAETHETTCPNYDWCTALGCTWEVHHADCPWGPCTLTEGCEMVKGHPGECTGRDTFDQVIDTEDELAAALTTGGEVTLGGNIEVTATIEIPAGITVTLDMDGYNITSALQTDTTKHIYPIDNYGTLTIKDSVGTGSISGRGIYNRDGATITVDGAKIVAQDWNGGAGIWGYGSNSKVYLNNATIIGNTGVVSSEGYLEINGGTYTCYSGIADDGTQLTSPTYNIRAYNGLKITGGTFTSRHGVISLGGGTGVIEDGSYTINFTAAITSNVVYVSGDANLTINDGEFISDNTSGKADSGAAVLVSGTSAELTINDGTYVGTNGMVSVNGNTVINGGSFDTVLENNGYGSIEDAVAEDAIVTVAGTEYVKTEEGLTEVPKTTISNSQINMGDSAETYISTEISNLKATESVVIKLYSGETQIATTTLQKPEYYVMETLGVKIILTGESSSWETIWEKDMPRADFVPDKMVLYVDGQEMNTANVPMISTNGEAAVNWADVPGVNPVPVAQIGEVGYGTLADALNAANSGETIELVWKEGDAPIAMNGAVFGKSVTITGTATVDWNKGFLFVGRGGEGNGTVTFENANLTSASNSASYGIHVSGREKNTDNKYDGTLIINNSTIELDYLINKGSMTLNDSTLTVKNGFSVGGRPASETESGTDATATLTLNGSSLTVYNHNGMGLGYEAIGVMNVNAGSTFNCTQSFLITEKGTMNVNGGTIIIDGTLTTNKNLFISGNSVVKIENLQGRATVMDDTVLTGSYIKSTTNGTTRVLGDLTLNGGFGAAYLMTAGTTTSTSDYNGTITIEDGTTVNVSYGIEMNGNATLNGGAIKLSGGNSSGDLWGCVFQDGNLNINTDIEVDGLTGESAVTAPIYFTNATATINSDVVQKNSMGEVVYLVNSNVTLNEGSVDALAISVDKDSKFLVNAKDMGDGRIATVKAPIHNVTPMGELGCFNNDGAVVSMDEDRYLILTTPVTQVGDEFFYDLQEAINAAEGETITLLKDVSASGLTIAADQNVTIDLNGNDLTLAAGADWPPAPAITVNGNLTITGDGNVPVVGEGMIPGFATGIKVVEGAKLVLNGGDYTFSGTQGEIAMVYGNIEINGGSFATTGTASMIGTETSATVSITGGKFSAVPIDSDAKSIAISGGTFGEEVPEEFFADGYGTMEVTTADGDTVYTVVEKVSSESGTVSSLDEALGNQDSYIEIPEDAAFEQFTEVNGEHKDYPKALTIDAKGNVITGTGYISSDNAITIDNLTAKKHDVVMPDGGKVSFSADGTATFTPNFLEDEGYGRVNVTDNKGKTRYFYLDSNVGFVVAADGAQSDDNKHIIEGNKNGPAYNIHTEQNTLHDYEHYIGKDPNMIVYCNGFYGSINKIWITGGQYGTNRLYIYENGKEQVDDIEVDPGCTIVTLKKDYLNDLDEDDDYYIHFQYMNHGKNDSVSVRFEVLTVSSSNADPTNYKTGDSIFMAVSVMTFSAAALAVLLMGKKKYA